ncbi:MAG: hypothetical protein LQ346_004180 [Caloplaca aetnensis]|nr:MAG: hypothetical protein LQ346_004180 [Caloplaca aetnensis]
MRTIKLEPVAPASALVVHSESPDYELFDRPARSQPWFVSRSSPQPIDLTASYNADLSGGTAGLKGGGSNEEAAVWIFLEAYQDMMQGKGLQKVVVEAEMAKIKDLICGQQQPAPRTRPVEVLSELDPVARLPSWHQSEIDDASTDRRVRRTSNFEATSTQQGTPDPNE